MEINISNEFKVLKKDYCENGGKDLYNVKLYTKDEKEVYSFIELKYLRQFSDNKFVAISTGGCGYFFEVFCYCNDKCNILFQKEFPKFDDLDDIVIGDTLVLRGIFDKDNKNVDDRQTILYNCRSDKYFSDNNLEVLKITLQDNQEYLLGVKKVKQGKTTDELTMLINPFSLEADGFYSSLQDRYIKIKENDGISVDKCYGLRLAETELEEVDCYLKSLEERRIIEEKEKSKLIRKILISRNGNKK